MQTTTPKSPLQRYGALIALLVVVVAGTLLLYRSSSTGPPAPPAAAPAAAPLDNLPVVLFPNPALHVDRVIVGDVDVPPAKTVKATAAQPISIQGWAVDAKAATAATGVMFLVDDKTRFPARFGGLRADVADAFKNPAYAQSAFAGEIPANSLTPGNHVIGMLIQSADRSTDYKVPEILKVIVTP